MTKSNASNFSLTNKLASSFFLFIFMSIFPFQKVQSQTFVHPGIPFTMNDLNQLKANLTQEPWLSAYNNFKNDAKSKLTYVRQGPFANVGRAPDVNLGAWRSDMQAVHNLAFMWIFTNDSAYARKATDILDAWAVTNTQFSGGEMALDLGDYVTYFVPGADILKSTFPGWSAANTANVNNYFANLVWPNASVPNPVKGLNQGALQLKIALSVAAFLDDPVKWNQALEVYRTDAGGGLQCSLPNGQVGDAGRDEGHWFGQADALAWGAEIAWKQRVDLFSEFGNRLHAVGELYTSFHVDTTGLYSNFIPFGGYYGYYTSYGTTGGGRRQGLLYNIINGAYSLRKGVPTPYSNAYRTIVGESNISFLYRKTSDTSTASPLPPLVYPTSEPVTNLTNVDIGNTGMAGSAAYSNGTWTINGAGNAVADAVNFTSKQVTGNVRIIAKVTGSTLNNTTTGVMIRESLGVGAKYVSLNLAKAGGASLSSRGMGPANTGAHGQPKAPWWLKLERFNGRVTAFHSVDGINWTCIGAYISTLADTAYIGLYTISNNTSALNTATFTNVSVTNSSPAGSPAITSATQASGVTGTAFNYTVTATNTPTTYGAAGLPAGLSIDAATGIISGTPTATGTFMVTLGATNANGTGTAMLVLKVTSNAPPAAPTTLAATVVNISSIRLTWTSSANATSYAVKRSSTAGGPYTTIASGVTGTTFTDASPVPEINNYYVVTAFAGALESSVSNEVSGSVPPAIPEKPAIAMPGTQLNLSWAAASGAVTYNVKRSSTMGGPYVTIANVSTNSYVDAAVTGGSAYYYVISSVGNTLESGNSPEAFGVPGATSVTWSQTPPSTTWNQASNWAEGYVPASPSIITFKSSTDSVLTNDISSLQVSRILFDTTANAYTLSGNSITPGSDIINNSVNDQTITMPLVINNQIRVNTGGNINFNGAISGSGGIEKTGSGVITMNNGSSTYAGNTIISGTAVGWPPNSGIGIAASGTGTSGSPVTGALGTGTITMNGGALFSNGPGNFTLYNNIVIPAGKFSYFFQLSGGLYLAGKLSGSGTVRNDGNVGNGLHLSGDNSGFTGTFQAFNRSSNHRIRFDNAASGSANAIWSLDNRFTDGQGLAFGTGTIHFGSLTGNGAIRNDASGTATISIGALNANSNFGGSISSANPANIVNVVKVGTGNLIFSGNNSYTGTTTVQSGTFLLNNNPATGTFTSPITANAGTFGGTGKSNASVTIGTGAGTGATLEPGNLAIGTFTTTASLTLRQDATYKVEINTGNATADKMVAASVSLINNPQLNVTAIATGSMPVTSFTIIDNTGAGAVAGIFDGLPEQAVVTAGGYNFRITYQGGSGNDVVLIDERGITLPVAITSYTAKLQNAGAVLLNWTTITERNNAYYAIERSTDGNNFTLISDKIISAGNNGATYAFTDNHPAIGNNFYRLTQVDKDGKVSALGIRVIKINSKESSWMVYPNPVKGRTIYIKAGDVNASQASVAVSLFNSSGTKLLTRTFSGITTGSILTLNTGMYLPAGNYLLRINNKKVVQLIVIR